MRREIVPVSFRGRAQTKILIIEPVIDVCTAEITEQNSPFRFHGANRNGTWKKGHFTRFTVISDPFVGNEAYFVPSQRLSELSEAWSNVWRNEEAKCPTDS